MKKYYLGDAFTILQCLITSIILAGAFTGMHLETALLLFAAAELCDAVDGPCARRWEYPNDGKYRWWRVYASEIDKITDLLTGLVMITFTIQCVNRPFGLAELISCSIIGLVVQFFIYDCRGFGFNFLAKHEKPALLIIHIRRFIYVVNILGVIDYLIWKTVWIYDIKIALTGLIVSIGLFLLLFKSNRLRDL